MEQSEQLGVRAEESVEPPPLAPGEPDLPGPFAVGRWAAGFRDFLRQRPRVRLIGEVVNYSASAKAIYFDLRDGDGAVPCSIWLSDLKKLDLPEGALKDGVEIVAAGGPDYFPGSERSSPSFSFRVSYLRPAGEGDLLAQLERLRRQLASEGLFEPQKLLPRPLLPRAIGVVVGSNSAAYADILAGLERRSWRGRLVLAHPPVQGRAAAPRIAAAIRELAAVPEVETIIVSRGGGSLTDLWCFCDEALCRTVALLGVPVISAVGHEVDRTLIDDVAAVACSTPTHAAEAAVGIDVAAARASLVASASRFRRLGR
ncbi:MAG: exodeoxyribonuclease VII large subunit, partial [Solirubrobacterales bacterium]